MKLKNQTLKLKTFHVHGNVSLSNAISQDFETRFAKRPQNVRSFLEYEKQ